MNILLTGGSSFTGYWFAEALAENGHAVTAAFLRPRNEYTGLRGLRIARLAQKTQQHFGVPFGSRAFSGIIKQQPHWDILCHHAAHVRDYKSPVFNVSAALAKNTANLPALLDLLQKHGCRRVALTGSYFEAGEGGERDAPALSPYGLSKSLTTACFKYYTHRAGMRLGHFVIPNPFGALEKPAFTAYLMQTWKDNETAVVNTPDYIRDNIHADLLAKDYARFCAALPASAGFSRRRPSGYAETQEAFARRYAREMRKRLNLPCRVSIAAQTDHPEPLKRVNSQPPEAAALGWSEKKAWDDIADFYKKR